MDTSSLFSPGIPDWGCIDIHAHGRGDEWWYKATLESTIRLALSQGVTLLVDMPNVAKNHVITPERAVERRELVPPVLRPNYRMHIGVTKDESQLNGALWAFNHIAEVVGLKEFASESVGDLAVPELDDQRFVFQTLTKCRFNGVKLVHPEKTALLRPELWVPGNPFSHTLARPADAEVESVFDQIMLMEETQFTGHLHLCHLSDPRSVQLVWDAKQKGFRISCGVTPHHLKWHDGMLLRADWWRYKMNPPLRPKASMLALRQQLVEGMIDLIETDHAPHTEDEQMNPPHMSGYPSLTLYAQFVAEFLPALGLTLEQIKGLTRDNIINVFGDRLRITE